MNFCRARRPCRSGERGRAAMGERVAGDHPLDVHDAMGGEERGRPQQEGRLVAPLSSGRIPA